MSKIFINTDENNKVVFYHNFPFHKKHGFKKNGSIYESEEDLINDKRGYVIEQDNIPEPEEQEGKSPKLYYDGIDFWYQYIDRVSTPEERIEQLEKASGVDGKAGGRGIAQRLDDIEDRIDALENA